MAGMGAAAKLMENAAKLNQEITGGPVMDEDDSCQQ